IVLVPLDPESGVPDGEHAIRPEQKTPVTIANVPVGQYLIVAEVTGQGFHEVYRTVPEHGQSWARLREIWVERADGSVDLLDIDIPATEGVTRGMALFKGGDFRAGMKGVPSLIPHNRHVDAFYLDTTEVSIKDFMNLYPDTRNLLPVSYA